MAARCSSLAAPTAATAGGSSRPEFSTAAGGSRGAIRGDVRGRVARRSLHRQGRGVGAPVARPCPMPQPVRVQLWGVRTNLDELIVDEVITRAVDPGYVSALAIA